MNMYKNFLIIACMLLVSSGIKAVLLECPRNPEEVNIDGLTTQETDFYRVHCSLEPDFTTGVLKPAQSMRYHVMSRVAIRAPGINSIGN